MREFFGGMVYDVKGVQFDLVGQMYCATIKQYKFLNYWRREIKNIGIEARDVWIYINPITPHIAKLISDGKSVEDICAEIETNIRSYIDYASNNKNKNWVSYISNEASMFADRLEIEEAGKLLDISDEEEAYVEAFDPYLK